MKDFGLNNMSRKWARTKGHSFERLIARYFQFCGYPKAQRQLEYQIDQAQGIDLANTGHFKIQCKKTKKYVSINTIQEVKLKEPDDCPVLIAQGDRQEPMAVLPLDHFLTLVSGFDDFDGMLPYSDQLESIRKSMKEIRNVQKT